MPGDAVVTPLTIFFSSQNHPQLSPLVTYNPFIIYIHC